MVCLAVDCGMPLSIERGSFILGQATTSYLDTVTYTCEPGYDLLGPMARYCQADGEWSETEPVCQCETDMHSHILHTNSQCPPDTSYTVSSLQYNHSLYSCLC